MKKIELLAPAGNMEKLRMAVLYGADAVYLAGEKFGLRTASDNFTFEEMKEAVDFAHKRGVKVYLTMNIIPHNDDLKDAGSFVERAAATGIDAVIVSDPGMLSIIKRTAPGLGIHVSTQANITNTESVKFWHSVGASRVVLARELSLADIRQIRDNCTEDMELEAFVHGAMCISYSGRCLLSNYMVGRDANMGDCAQPCRWKYHLVEEKRPGEYFPIQEDSRGTFIFNSKDLCMIRHIPELISSGVTSFKIEGRVKSSFYVATVVKAYRDAIDAYYVDNESYTIDEKWFEEISKVSNRDFTTGFFFKKPGPEDHNYKTSSYIRNYDFVGVVKGYDNENKMVIIEQRNRFRLGDTIEVMPPKGQVFEFVVNEMYDNEGNAIEVAPHPKMVVRIPMEPLPDDAILRIDK
ncbi:MAG: peptidase U32 family protein [Acetivibrionales bacterium]|jgi:putative protease|nr:U32 family peptidase [Clostridiaceae bacterium]